MSAAKNDQETETESSALNCHFVVVSYDIRIFYDIRFGHVLRKEVELFGDTFWWRFLAALFGKNVPDTFLDLRGPLSEEVPTIYLFLFLLLFDNIRVIRFQNLDHQSADRVLRIPFLLFDNSVFG